MFDFDLLADVDPPSALAGPQSSAGSGRREAAPAARPTYSLLLGRNPMIPRSSEVEVEVRTMGGEVAAKLRLPRTALVEQVKQELERRQGISPAEQRLLLGSKVLEGSSALVEAAMGHHGLLQLTMVHVPGPKRVALSGGYEGALLLWDLGCGEHLERLSDGTAHPTCVDMSWPLRRALCGCSDGVLRMWDLHGASLAGSLRGHASEVTCLAVDWDAQRAVSGCKDGAIRYWDVDCGTTIAELAGHAQAALCVALDVKEQKAVSGGMDRTLILWDLESGEVTHRLEGHATPINCVAAMLDFRPDPLAIAGSFGILRLWTFSTFPFHFDFTVQASAVTCLAFNWSTTSFLSGSADSTILCGSLDINTTRVHFKHWLRGHHAPVTCLAADWPRQRAASGSEDGAVRTWDLRRGEALQVLTGHTAGVLCVALALQGSEEDAEEDGGALELLSARPNLAHCCSARASSSKSADRAPEFAVDGRRGTRWTSAYRDDQWLAVDLGRPCKVSRVDLKWEAAHAESYDLQASMDGETWQTIAKERGKEGWVVTELPSGSMARWLRMYGHKRSTAFGFSIWAFCVY